MKSRMILAVAMMTGTLLAQGPGGPDGARPATRRQDGRRGAALANAGALKTALGLTDPQVQQLRSAQAAGGSGEAAMDQIRVKRQALPAMESATPTPRWWGS